LTSIAGIEIAKSIPCYGLSNLKKWFRGIATIRKAEWVNVEFSTYSEDEVSDLFRRLKGCRDRFVQQGEVALLPVHVIQHPDAAGTIFHRQHKSVLGQRKLDKGITSGIIMPGFSSTVTRNASPTGFPFVKNQNGFPRRCSRRSGKKRSRSSSHRQTNEACRPNVCRL
jgi:hypothetical protein